MNMNLNNNISFGRTISTPLLLRAGSGSINFEDAKLLNNQFGVKYSGHISFYKRAIEIAKKAANMNKNLLEIFDILKNTPKNELPTKIQKYTSILGESIDIEI